MPQASGPKFVTLPEIRRAAKARLPRDHWNFGDGAAETESSKRRNRRHIDRLAIQQNVLVDVRNVDLRTSLLGVALEWPVAMAPMAGQGRTLQWLSGARGWQVEDVAKRGSLPQMFQLYAHGAHGWMSE